MDQQDSEGPVEIAIIGDLTDNESDITEKLLGVAPGEPCVLFIDSPGGSPYTAVSLMTLIRLRAMQITAVVTGECSSAMLWPFAACPRRLVTPYSVLLFHPMKWQSEEHVGLAEAAEWARHFGHLEQEMDRLLAELFGVDVKLIEKWISPGRYVTGPELAEAGLADLIELGPMYDLAERADFSEGAARAKPDRPTPRRRPDKGDGGESTASAKVAKNSVKRSRKSSASEAPAKPTSPIKQRSKKPGE